MLNDATDIAYSQAVGQPQYRYQVQQRRHNGPDEFMSRDQINNNRNWQSQDARNNNSKNAGPVSECSDA